MESSAAENLAGVVAVAEYRCPGESYTISREVHLGRLAMSFPACRECPHRHDTGVLSKRTVSRIERSAVQACRDATVTKEGVEGVYLNQITPGMTRELSAALGLYVRRHVVASQGKARPAVVLAGDDRPCTPELVAAASEGLRMCGCDVIEIAPATAACLVAAIAAREADGGLLIGNVSGRAANVGIKFWGAGGRPLSSPGDLDELCEIWRAGVDRPTRTYGGLERIDAQSAYLAGLRDYFHALRPLRFVLDTACGPLLLYLRTLLATTACEILPLSPLVVTRFIGSGKLSGVSSILADPMNRVTTSALAQAVRTQRAHFGLWADGDGESCRWVDEHGREIGTGDLVSLLASVEEFQHTSPATRTTCSDLTRQQMYRNLGESGSEIIGSNDGLIVFRDRPGAGDALRALALLLAILSTSDRPLSAVMANLKDGLAAAH